MTVLVLPGWLTTPDMYKDFVDEIGATLYTYKGDTIKNRAENLKHYLSKTNFDYVIGFDMGASIALRASVKEKLILINPPYHGFTDLCKKFNKEGFDAMRQTKLSSRLMLHFLANKIPSTLIEVFQKCDIDKELVLFDNMDRDDFVTKPRHTQTVLIWSKGDKILPDSHMERLVADCRNTVVKRIPGGHLPLFDCPKELLLEVKSSLK